jgi:endonuclease III
VKMPDTHEEILKILIERGLELHKKSRETVTFSLNPDADSLLNNIETYPHFFVLGCVMDRQIKAGRAGLIPYKIAQHIGGVQVSDFLKLDLKETIRIFNEGSLHRMPTLMSKCFYDAVQRIHTEYSDNASDIWKQGNPSSGEVIRRFEQFNGVGQKISTMATNILVREFKVQLADNSAIDISVDVQIDRVFKRLGLVPKDALKDDIITAARKYYPAYPGLFDSLCWEIGQGWCRPERPECGKCFLEKYCPKIAG